MTRSEEDTGPAAQSIRLLRTKLYVPRAHPELVDREPLAERLDESFCCKLTLVSAPAGSGKTTLLSAWIQRSRLPAAWVSLDEKDNDPGRFWSYVVAALQTIQPGIGQSALAMLQSPQPAPIEAVLTELLNEAGSAGSDFLLVLDDYHSIEAPSIHTGLAFLLDRLPVQMHLAISSRVDPPLPLAAMRARRQLVELSTADLRFSQAETTTFLNQVMNLNLAADEIAVLQDLTEGWVAGLQLAALALRSQGIEDVSAFIRSFTGSHRYVFDYLAQEVLDRQPELVRRFLLQTSVLERLCGPLCDEVVGSFERWNVSTLPPHDREHPSHSSNQRSNVQAFQRSNEILEYLDRAHLFIVPLDQHRHWYRYHHLFRDFLLARLEAEWSRTEIAGLHRRASSWLAENDFTGEAIAHALSAGDTSAAAELIRRSAKSFFMRSELVTLNQWLGAFPAHTLARDPQLSMIYAWALLATGRGEEVEHHLQNIERCIGAAAGAEPQTQALSDKVRGALAEACIIRSNISFHRMEVSKVIEWAERARAYFESGVDGLYISNLALRNVAAFNLAITKEISGQVQEAVAGFEEAIRLSREDDNQHLLPMSQSHLAQLLVLQGQLQRAGQFYRQSMLDSAKAARLSPLSGMADIGLGNLLYEWNELEEAAISINRGLELGKLWKQWEILLAGYTGLARLRSSQGDAPGAFSLLQELQDQAQELHVPWISPQIQSFRVLLSIRHGQASSTLDWVQSKSALLEGEIPFGQEWDGLILARALAALGRLDEAAGLASRLVESAKNGKRQGRAIEALVLQAAIHWKMGAAPGGRRAALACLDQALRLAAAEGYLRTFLDEGEPVREMLANLQMDLQANLQMDLQANLQVDLQANLQMDLQASADLEAYRNRLLAAFEGSKKVRAAPHAVEAGLDRPAPLTAPSSLLLSAREVEVLRLMADGLTNQEIADSLVISLNTVKTHVKNILARLEVTNRTQATARARQLGVIGDQGQVIGD